MIQPLYQLKVSEEVDGDDDFVPPAYLYLPSHPKEADSYGCVAKTVRLRDIYPYSGETDILLDFDKNNHVIGVEILG